VGIPSWYSTKPARPTQPVVTSTRNGLATGEENGEFCVTVGHVTRTVGMQPICDVY